MSTLRDLIAVVGCIGVGWFTFVWNHQSDRGMVTGITVMVIMLLVCVVAIRGDSRRTNHDRAKMRELEIRNSYLESAIKQIGEKTTKE